MALAGTVDLPLPRLPAYFYCVLPPDQGVYLGVDLESCRGDCTLAGRWELRAKPFTQRYYQARRPSSARGLRMR